MKKLSRFLCPILAALILLCALPTASADTLRGDLNGDGRINSLDALTALLVTVEKISPDDDMIRVGDINSNGRIDSNDALIILRYAVNLINRLPDPGSLPVGYEPISVKNYYDYVNITPIQRQAYDIMREAALGFASGAVNMPYGASEIDICIAYTALRNDNPDIFWLPYSYGLYTLPGENGNPDTRWIAFEFSGDVHYIYDRAAAMEMTTKMEARADEIIDSVVNARMDEAQRAEAIHDYLVTNATYDYAAVINPASHPEAFNAYGVIVDGTGVCESFSRAFQYLCYRAGVMTTLVVGSQYEGSKGHMWNAVRLNGDWYMTDVTWDNASPDGYKTFENQTTEVFLYSHTIYKNLSQLSDKEILTEEYNIAIPECTVTAENYFFKNDLYFESPKELSRKMDEKLAQRISEAEPNEDVDIQFMLKGIRITSGQQITSYIGDDFFERVNALLAPYGRSMRNYSYGYTPGSNCFYIVAKWRSDPAA